MNTVLLLPLDERPCNFDFPGKIFDGQGMRLLRPERLGKKKTPADGEEVARFLVENAPQATAAVLSLDTLLYGGLIPSRLHHLPEEVLEQRFQVLEKMKEANPAIRLFAYQCIMRCPTYSSSDEEPDYYEDWGAEIHQIGVHTHKKQLGLEDGGELEALLAKVPADCLADYTGRRERNLRWNLRALDLAERGILDFLIIPQDDSAPYGFTAIDQKTVRRALEEKRLNDRVYLYPGADELGMTLTARVRNVLEGKRPRVYVKYASEQAKFQIPPYEDRSLGETVKYQLMAAGCLETQELSQADFVLAVTAPGGQMLEAPEQPAANMAYDVERNMPELFWFLEDCRERGIPVSLLDNAYVNGGEVQLLRVLDRRGWLLDLAGYSGWNTSANSLGTAIAQGVRYLYHGPTPASRNFLVERYIEDVGYGAVVRGKVTWEQLPALGMNYFDAKEQRGEAAALVRQGLEEFVQREMGSIASQVTVEDLYLPWSRMFEIGLTARWNG